MATIKSIEENAKAYTELINRLEDVKDAIKKQNYGIAMDILYKPYPEFHITTSASLAESEDEKIRKFIATAIENLKIIDNEDRNSLCNKALAWLEKQGEQQDVSIQINPSEYINDMGGNGCYLKSTDKIEPKFKVGDWIICCDYEPVQIISVRTNAYEMSNGDIRPFWMVDNNNNIRLWTIQDAKDGDMLAYRGEQWIFIYKERKDETLIDYYALASEKGLTINDVALTVLLSCIVPATKEQRDLLFQKMHEAGYEWDAEKKVLKKIEQNLDWTEEDIHKLNILSAMVANNTILPKDETINLMNWLKQFRGRCAQQPNQEWSEEDERVLGIIIAELSKLSGKSLSKDEWFRCNDFLNNLRPQNTWKPSESDILLLERIANGKYNPQDFQASLGGLIGQLKKLREG